MRKNVCGLEADDAWLTARKQRGTSVVHKERGSAGRGNELGSRFCPRKLYPDLGKIMREEAKDDHTCFK